MPLSPSSKKEEYESIYHSISQQFEVSKVKYQIKSDTLQKELSSIKAQRDIDVSDLQNALSKYMETNEEGMNQLDELRMNLDEANAKIEKLLLNERELRKSLDHAVEEWKNHEQEKLEAVSSHEIVITVRSLITKHSEPHNTYPLTSMYLTLFRR